LFGCCAFGYLHDKALLMPMTTKWLGFMLCNEGQWQLLHEANTATAMGIVS
jgi:hypothetical protein